MKKYRKGERIKSLEEMLAQEFVMCHDKVYHRAWVRQWQINLAEQWIKMGVLYTVVPNTPTVREDFLKKYPDAPLNTDGTPKFCPCSLDKSYKNGCDEGWGDCAKCWSQPVKKS